MDAAWFIYVEDQECFKAAFQQDSNLIFCHSILSARLSMAEVDWLAVREPGAYALLQGTDAPADLRRAAHSVQLHSAGKRLPLPKNFPLDLFLSLPQSTSMTIRQSKITFVRVRWNQRRGAPKYAGGLGAVYFEIEQH